MSVPIPLRGDFNAAQLRGLAKRTKDGPQARGLLALAVIYDGGTRSEAAKLGGVGLQIVRDWVLRLNARGPEGLLDGNAGPALISTGPNVPVSDRVRLPWRCPTMPALSSPPAILLRP